jgi:predicted ATPase
MEQIDFDKLRKMPPDRRAKALEELQDKLTKLIAERSKEIIDTQQEIKDAQDFLKEAQDELRVLEEMQEQAPGIKKVDVEKLFEREEKRTEPMRPRGRELEAIAADAPRQFSPQEQQAYISNLARQPVTNIYERVNQIRQDISETGVITAYQQNRLNLFGAALHEKEEAIRAGEYAAGKKAANLLTAAEKAVAYASGTTGNQFYTKHGNQ